MCYLFLHNKRGMYSYTKQLSSQCIAEMSLSKYCKFGDTGSKKKDRIDEGGMKGVLQAIFFS